MSHAVEQRFKIFDGLLEAPKTPFLLKYDQRARLTDYPGQPVVATFWATWCGPCAREMPALDRLARALPDVVFAPLAQDRDASILDIERYYQLHQITSLPMAIDNGRALARELGVPGTPTTLILDGTAGIRAAAVGNVDWTHPDIHDYLRSLA